MKGNLQLAATARARELALSLAGAPAIQGSAAGSILFGILELLREPRSARPVPSEAAAEVPSRDRPPERSAPDSLEESEEQVPLDSLIREFVSWLRSLDHTHIIAFVLGLCCDTACEIYISLRRLLRWWIARHNRAPVGRNFARVHLN